MFQYKSVRQQLREERKKNDALIAKQMKTTADLEYVAMMADVELDSGESVESEVSEYEQEV